MEVYAAIAAVQNELAAIGISKDKKNAMQGYNFRGIDDVYNALAPILAKNKLCILPRVLARECVERTTAKGGAIFYVTVEAEYDLVSAVDGSKHTIKTYGEAMDSGDKATNKAMSAAYKYAAFQTFCIPVDAEDADATTHEVKPKTPAPPKQVSNKTEKPPVPPPLQREQPDDVPEPPIPGEKMSERGQWAIIAKLAEEIGLVKSQIPVEASIMINRVITTATELTWDEAQTCIKEFTKKRDASKGGSA